MCFRVVLIRIHIFFKKKITHLQHLLFSDGLDAFVESLKLSSARDVGIANSHKHDSQRLEHRVAERGRVVVHVEWKECAHKLLLEVGERCR